MTFVTFGEIRKNGKNLKREELLFFLKHYF